LDNTFRVGVASHERPSALQSNFMKSHTSNIVLMIVGLVFVLKYVHARLHHQYEFYYDYYGGGFVSNIFIYFLESFFSWVV
jgi:hypothetical protein